MLVGFSLWKVLVSSFNPIEVVVFSLLATFFNWLYEVTWERKSEGKESS